MSFFVKSLLGEEKTNGNGANHVRYKKTCDVILIPSKEEYVEFGIQLWYKPKDFKIAKAEAKEELRELLEYLPQLSFSSALTLLYQPSKPSTVHSTTSITRNGNKISDVSDVDAISPWSDCMDIAAEVESPAAAAVLQRIL